MSALLAQASAAAAASLGGAPGGGGPAVGLPNLPDPTSQANMLEQAQQWSDTMSRLTPRELAMLLPQGILAGALPGGGGVKQLAPTVANPAPPTTTAASTTGQPTPAQAVAVGAGESGSGARACAAGVQRMRRPCLPTASSKPRRPSLVGEARRPPLPLPPRRPDPTRRRNNRGPRLYSMPQTFRRTSPRSRARRRLPSP